MYHDDSEIFFPLRVIGTLRDLRGEDWRALIERVMRLPDTAPEGLAFSLMMIRLGSCLNCYADSYRAMRGCTLCARHTISRYKGSDEDLLALWESAYAEVVRWLELGIPPIMGVE